MRVPEVTTLPGQGRRMPLGQGADRARSVELATGPRGLFSALTWRQPLCHQFFRM